MDGIKNMSHKMESIPDGPIKSMIMGLKGTALKQLEGVKGADKVIELLKGMGATTEHTVSPAAAEAATGPAIATVAPAATVVPAATAVQASE